MADDSTKGVDNVIKGPWSKAKIITKSQRLSRKRK